jgi:predicted nucleotidyltransferase
MSPHSLIDRDAVVAFCHRYHIKRLGLFGSVLRDAFSPDSDVDVLVELQAGHVPGLDFVSMERQFSGLLQGRRVDIVTPKFLNARILDQVLASAEPLYVAAWSRWQTVSRLIEAERQRFGLPFLRGRSGLDQHEIFDHRRNRRALSDEEYAGDSLRLSRGTPRSAAASFGRRA